MVQSRSEGVSGGQFMATCERAWKEKTQEGCGWVDSRGRESDRVILRNGFIVGLIKAEGLPREDAPASLLYERLEFVFCSLLPPDALHS
mmetsp:Transcript_34303/g.67812  ORF Transcript_34303/g.67812 Transcript_34303/m.67812 type:complete len:89 (+) Transcript_34303:318-584(+)